MRKPLIFLLSAAGLVCLGSVQANAEDRDPVERCIVAAEQGQELRDLNKYTQAREMFVSCQRALCPAVIRDDCTGWLKALDEKMPSVTLDPRDGTGNVVSDVTVTVDRGQATAKRIGGQEYAIDPGQHLLRCEAPGFSPVEERVTVLPGERGRLLAVRFDPAPAPLDAARAEQASASDERRPRLEAQGSSGRRPPLAGWLLAGISLASFGSEAYFGLTGVSQHNSDVAAGGCAPHCSASERSSIEAKFLVADVSLGVGLASAGLATYFFFAAEQPGTPAPSIAVAPSPGGAIAAVSGQF